MYLPKILRSNTIINRIRVTLSIYKLWWENFKINLNTPFKLDVHAVEHCNLNCIGCSHFSPLAESSFLDPSELDKNLRKLTKFQSSFYAFQILGGEPLLHPQLAEIMDVARRNFDRIRITLMTNGILLLKEEKLSDDFWEACRRNNIVIRLTQYPIGLDVDAVKRKVEENGIKFELYKDRSDDALRWSKFQLSEQGVKSRIHRLKIFRLKYCPAMNCLQLVGNKIYPCPLSAYIGHLNKAFGRNFSIKKGDYISIDQLKTTWPLRKLIIMSIPFCRFCGYSLTKVNWEQSKHEPQEWIDTSKDEI